MGACRDMRSAMGAGPTIDDDKMCAGSDLPYHIPGGSSFLPGQQLSMTGATHTNLHAGGIYRCMQMGNTSDAAHRSVPRSGHAVGGSRQGACAGGRPDQACAQAVICVAVAAWRSAA